MNHSVPRFLNSWSLLSLELTYPRYSYESQRDANLITLLPCWNQCRAFSFHSLLWLFAWTHMSLSSLNPYSLFSFHLPLFSLEPSSLLNSSQPFMHALFLLFCWACSHILINLKKSIHWAWSYIKLWGIQGISPEGISVFMGRWLLIKWSLNDQINDIITRIERNIMLRELMTLSTRLKKVSGEVMRMISIS